MEPSRFAGLRFAKNYLLSAFFFLLCLSFAPLCSNAQVLYGSLTGNVSDPTGAAIPKAKIEVLNTGTGLVKTQETDDRGAFLLSDLMPGTYK
jgi:Carboxypeptidase regulatory-like domain